MKATDRARAVAAIGAAVDALAAEGVRFTHAYCTSASCAASRSVILTGKFGHATGSYGHVHDYHHFSTFPEVESLPVLLQPELVQASWQLTG